MNRLEFAYDGVTKDNTILEFAPFYCPLFPKCEGYKTEVVDACSREELIKKAQKDPLILDYTKIEEVDYVCSVDYAKSIGKKDTYDYIVASHVIEHVTDIIAFFNDCTYLLKEDGIIRLFIPDKRYEFDYFRDVTPARVAIDTYLEKKGRNIHSIGTVLDYYLRSYRIGTSVYIPNSAFAYLKGDLVKPSDKETLEELVSYVQSTSDYIDVHSWVFTPKSFEIMIYELNLLGFINVTIDRIITNERTLEFFVDLKKGKIKEDNSEKRLQLYIDRKYEVLQEYDDMLELERLKKELNGNGTKEIYIYGINAIAQNMILMLEKMKFPLTGFVVSDGRRIEDAYDGYTILELSELTDSSNCCILIAINNFRDEIMPELEKRGFKTFF